MRIKAMENIPKFIGFFVFLFFGIILVSCNNCDSGTGNCCGKAEDNIFVTIKPLKSDYSSSVCQINSKSLSLNELAENARIHSAPSNNGDIVYSRKTEGEEHIRTVSINGFSDRLLFKSTWTAEGTISYPVISPDGSSFVFRAGTSLLFRRINASNSISITPELTEDVELIYSNKSEYLAFFKDHFLTGNMVLTIVRTDDPKQEVYSKELDLDRSEIISSPRVSWSEDDSRICFSLTDETKSELIVCNWQSNDCSSISIDEQGVLEPSFSPDLANVISFTSRNGDIWVRSQDIEDNRLYRIIESPENENNRDICWKPDGTSFLFNNYFKFNEEILGATLFLAEYDSENKSVSSISMIANNVLSSAFWQRQK